MTIKPPAQRDIPALRALWKAAFGDGDAFLNAFFSTAFSPRRCRCLFLEDTLAAALYWFDCQYRGKPAAYLYAIATAPGFRHRGLCRRLMADTHLQLSDLGYTAAFLVPAEPSLFSFYSALGYHIFSTAQTDTVAASQLPEALTKIGPQEYACRRRALLPPDSVIQEEEALALLNTQGEFYAGEGFLFPLIREEGGIFLPEYLGDPARLPGIAAALGQSSLRVRLPGGDIPFSMSLALADSPWLTGYLGLALD